MKHEGRPEFDLVVANTAFSIDEEFGSESYLLAVEHAVLVLRLLRNGTRNSAMPNIWRMRTLVKPREYDGSYSFNQWGDYQPEYFFRFKLVDDLAKVYDDPE